jgi:hypothetical protein
MRSRESWAQCPEQCRCSRAPGTEKLPRLPGNQLPPGQDAHSYRYGRQICRQDGCSVASDPVLAVAARRPMSGSADERKLYDRIIMHLSASRQCRLQFINSALHSSWVCRTPIVGGS